MKNKSLDIVFWILVIIFIVLVCYFVVPFNQELKQTLFLYIAGLGFVFLILGGTLVFLSIKYKLEKRLKIFLILTGSAPIVAFISVILHNLVYGLFIYLFGEGFWRGGDEPVFFLIAIVVCPIVFLIGMIGSIVLMVKCGRKKGEK